MYFCKLSYLLIFKCICPKSQMNFSKLSNVFVQNVEYIFPSLTMYLFELQWWVAVPQMLHSPNWSRHFLLSTQEICSEKKLCKKWTNWCSARFTPKSTKGCESSSFEPGHKCHLCFFCVSFQFSSNINFTSKFINVFCCVVKLSGSMSMM